MAEATAAAADAIVDEPRGSAFDDVAGSRGATAEQVRAAEEVIDALAVHAYDPADIANPALARHYRVLECQALDVPWTDADERDGSRQAEQAQQATQIKQSNQSKQSCKDCLKEKHFPSQCCHV